MRISKTLITLSLFIVVLVVITSGIGLFKVDGDGPFIFTTVHGEEVELNGRGLYFYDTSFKVPVLRGTDAILLFIGLPLLIVSIVLYKQGSLRAGLMLTGLLVCFLYNAASVAFGVAYNTLYLIYLISFSVCLYAFILAFNTIDLTYLEGSLSSNLPYRGTAIFIFIAGLSPLVWLVDIVFAMLDAHVPQGLAHYTTDITTLLDVGIISPAAFIAGFLLLRRRPLGVFMASIILTLLSLIGLIVVSQSVMQFLDGIRLSPMQTALYVVPFVSLSVVAVWMNVRILRNINK